MKQKYITPTIKAFMVEMPQVLCSSNIVYGEYNEAGDILEGDNYEI